MKSYMLIAFLMFVAYGMQAQNTEQCAKKYEAYEKAFKAFRTQAQTQKHSKIYYDYFWKQADTRPYKLKEQNVKGEEVLTIENLKDRIIGKNYCEGKQNAFLHPHYDTLVNAINNLINCLNNQQPDSITSSQSGHQQTGSTDSITNSYEDSKRHKDIETTSWEEKLFNNLSQNWQYVLIFFLILTVFMQSSLLLRRRKTKKPSSKMNDEIQKLWNLFPDDIRVSAPPRIDSESTALIFKELICMVEALLDKHNQMLSDAQQPQQQIRQPQPIKGQPGPSKTGSFTSAQVQPPIRSLSQFLARTTKAELARDLANLSDQQRSFLLEVLRGNTHLEEKVATIVAAPPIVKQEVAQEYRLYGFYDRRTDVFINRNGGSDLSTVPENYQFELLIRNGKNQGELYVTQNPNIQRQMLNNYANTLAPVCQSDDSLSSGITKIQVLEPGVVTLRDGKWTLEKQIKIKLS